jgi:hypothetical protein
MILLLRVDSGHRAAGAVSIPPGTVVSVPGHGKMRIEDVDAVGGRVGVESFEAPVRRRPTQSRDRSPSRASARRWSSRA